MRAQLKKVCLAAHGSLDLPPTTSADADSAAARGALFFEKRREARYPTSDPAAVQILNETGQLPATVLDVSRSGVRLRLQAAIPKGAEVKITLQRNVVIFGQVRHCRRCDSGFDTGVAISDLSQSAGTSAAHIDDDLLSLYVIGKGLTVPEVIQLKAHLVNCEACRIRLGERDAVINPVRRRKILDLSSPARKDPADD